MKKIFTLLTAFALSLTVANAQFGNGSIKKAEGMPLEKSPNKIEMQKMQKSKSTPNKIEMEEDEHLVGFYTTDNLPSWGYGETYYSGQIQAGAVFDNELLGKFAGGEITKVRFGLGDVVELAGLYIYEVSTNYDIGEEPISSVDLSDYTAVEGWNDVTLTTPVTIESDKYYMIAYEYTQTSSVYPMLTDRYLTVDLRSDYGFLVYAEDGIHDYWHSYGDDYGSLCIQLVVKGGNLIDDDITLKDISAKKYASIGGGLGYSFNIKNDGNEIPTSYTLDLSIDGTVQETLDTPVTLSQTSQTIEGTLALPSGIETGIHTFAVQVATINGNVPTENTFDDYLETSFTVYNGSVDRQLSLIEMFTSVQCGACPYGDAVLDEIEVQNPDKYAVVEIHGSMMGDDPYYLEDGSTEYVEFFSMPGGSSYPSASFNRYLYDDADLNQYGEVAMEIGYTSAEYGALMFNYLVNSVYDDIPAFASVDIATDYDQSTRQLTIKVSGDGVSGATELLDGNRLTVYLTEDGLVSEQINYAVSGYLTENYTHDHVLRAIVSNEGYPWGDLINWTDGNSYENDYTITLDDSWIADNMHVVAFISKSFGVLINGEWECAEFEDGYVNNTNMVDIDTSTGISRTVSDSNATEVSRYTMDGRQLSSPVKGLNIVKMSDGTARKVIVR